MNLRFHNTRHTFATRLRANGVHEWDIRDLLGHTSVRLRHLQSLELGLEDYIAGSAIESFLNEEEGEVRNPTLGWPERCSTLLNLTGAIRSRADWEKKIRDALNSEDRQTFWTATEAARVLPINAWEVYFEPLKRGEDQWYFVMQTNDHDRVDRVIKFAEKTLPLQEIASGPSNSHLTHAQACKATGIEASRVGGASRIER